MLQPKKVKHRKQHRGRMRGKAKGGTDIAFGDYGLGGHRAGLDLQPADRGRASGDDPPHPPWGKVWINIFPDKPVTKKPAETRMGSGKGNPEGWVAVVKPGRVMFELSGVSPAIAKEAISRAAHKLPIKTKFVTRLEGRPSEDRSRSASYPRRSCMPGWTPPRRSFSTSGSSLPPVSWTTRCGSSRSATTSRGS